MPPRDLVKVLSLSVLLLAFGIGLDRLQLRLPDVLGFTRDEVVPWLEQTIFLLLGPCPLVEVGEQLSTFSDVKFYVGFTMWSLSWHMWLQSDFEQRHEVVSNFALKWLMAMGFNLTALSCLQCDNAAGVYWPLLMNGSHAVLVWIRFPAGKFLQAVEGEDCRQYTAHSIYEDLAGSKGQMRMIFFSQLILCAVVVYYNYAKYDPDSVTLSFWLLACSCVQIPAFLNRGSDSKVGRTWPLESFRGLQRINSHVSYSQNNHRYADADLSERMCMGFIVNMLLRDIVIFLTPLIFMQVGDAMDLVMNALALTFITTFDDLGEHKMVKIYRHDQTSWEDLDMAARDVGIAAEASGKRRWAIVLTLSFPLALWSFGFIHGLTLTPRPPSLWWLLWFASFWLDALFVLLAVYGRLCWAALLGVAIPLIIWAFALKEGSTLASHPLEVSSCWLGLLALWVLFSLCCTP